MAESSSSWQILVTGASGLVGSALVPALETRGHRVVRLKRGAAVLTTAEAGWDPATGRINLGRTGGIDAVVHLAGEPIARRWTADVKRRIRDSRVEGTRLLSEAISVLPAPPKVLVCASATGFYGDRGDEWLDESSAPGRGFLAEVVRDWETAAVAAVAGGVRVVHLRFGLVLTRKGGALARMLPAFRLGLGGRIADGRAWWSWVTLDDVIGVILQVLTDSSMRGAVNVVSPAPVTNGEFASTLGRVLRRPAILPLPRFAIEALFGEMGREALLASFRVRPSRLLDFGFSFGWPELENALRHALAGR